MDIKNKTARVKIIGKPITKGCAGLLFFTDSAGIIHSHAMTELNISLSPDGVTQRRSIAETIRNIEISIKSGDENNRFHFLSDLPSFMRAIHLVSHGYSVDASPILSPSLAPKKHNYAHTLGEMVEGEGYYLGLWEPLDKDSFSLRLLFDVYAAPTDIMSSPAKAMRLNFNEANTFCANMSNWHGHNGILVPDEDALLHILKTDSDSIEGKWFIPPACLLAPSPEYNDRTYYTYLEKFHSHSVLGNSFNSKDSLAHYYWSCSKAPVDNGEMFQAMSIKNDRNTRNLTIHKQISVRPIRLVRRRLTN